jgi:hypothetical protein
MAIHYCHECALSLGFINNLNHELNFTGSAYQIDKFIKHTIHQKKKGVVSIFAEPHYENYKKYILDTAASGSVEILDNGKINYVFYAGEKTGFNFKNGNFEHPTNSIKVVLPNDLSKIHAYPTSSYVAIICNCEKCGKPVLS